MSDDFDGDMAPMDEEAEDFANFDPAAYLAKRNQTRHGGADDPIDQEVRRVYSGGRRRRDGTRDDDVISEAVPVGLGAGLLGGLRSGEGVRIYADILGQALPLAGRYLPIIGCAILFMCVLVCGGGYLLIRLLAR